MTRRACSVQMAGRRCCDFPSRLGLAVGARGLRYSIIGVPFCDAETHFARWSQCYRSIYTRLFTHARLQLPPLTDFGPQFSVSLNVLALISHDVFRQRQS